MLAPARIPGAIPLAFGGMRLRGAAAAADRLRLAHERADRARGRGLLRAAGADAPGDQPRHARGCWTRFDPKYTLDAAPTLARWERPALIAWSADDRFFPPEHGRRLAKVIPGARFELIEGARTFSPEDQPERLAELIADFARTA